MIEGSKIDWAGHSRDGATNFREIKDLEESVKLAYDFYRKYPDETLIIVTADHETGGVVLGNGNYSLNLQALHQPYKKPYPMPLAFGASSTYPPNKKHILKKFTKKLYTTNKGT